MEKPRHMNTKYLRPDYRSILSAISKSGFGRITNLRWRNGRILSYKRHPTGKEAGRAKGFFSLKKAQVALIEAIESLPSGWIAEIAIQDGLPIRFSTPIRIK